MIKIIIAASSYSTLTLRRNGVSDKALSDCLIRFIRIPTTKRSEQKARSEVVKQDQILLFPRRKKGEEIDKDMNNMNRDLTKIFYLKLNKISHVSRLFTFGYMKDESFFSIPLCQGKI